MIYGHNNTIHNTKYVDVEVDQNGKVVAVWFRCTMLPFKQHNVDNKRANTMEQVTNLNPIIAIEFLDK